ncbi:MAG: DUF2291 domain-containing protein [Sphaerochaeta sp.]|nr:DUF2291 domain-containing protein [Sphaerochaeta sp.]
MKNIKCTTSFLAILLIVLLAFTLSSCTVRKLSEIENKASCSADSGYDFSAWTKSGDSFNAKEYVAQNWDTKIIPLFLENSIDVATVVSSLQLDGAETALATYAVVREDGSRMQGFKVVGEATVTEYDDSSRNGIIRIDFAPEDGQCDAIVQVGPVIKQTAIRDSLECIGFTDVGNQMFFAELSDELNKMMRMKTIDPLDLGSITGKRIKLYGSIKIDAGTMDFSSIIITPVLIEILEETQV